MLQSSKKARSWIHALLLTQLAKLKSCSLIHQLACYKHAITAYWGLQCPLHHLQNSDFSSGNQMAITISGIELG